MTDVVLTQQIQGPAGASGASASGTGFVTVLNGGIVSPASYTLTAGQGIGFMQAGTVPSPTALDVLSIQPVDNTKASFKVGLYDASFSGQDDSILAVGYNPDKLILGTGVASEPAAGFFVEQNYLSGGVNKILAYVALLGAVSGSVRALQASVKRSDCTGSVSLIAPPGATSFADIEDAAGNQLAKFSPVAAVGPSGLVTFVAPLQLESPAISWDSTVTGPTLTQLSTSAATAQTMVIAPQQSTAASNQQHGGLKVLFNAPTGTGKESVFGVSRGASGGVFAAMRWSQTAANGALFLGQGQDTAGDAAYILEIDSGNDTRLNSPASSSAKISFASADNVHMTMDPANGFLQLDNTLPVIGWTVATLQPSISQPNTSVATGTNLTIQAQGSTAATGVGGNLILKPGNATGATSGTPGNVQVLIATPSGTGAVGQFQCNISGQNSFVADNQGCVLGRTDASQVGMRIAPLIGQETTYAAIWVGSGATSPTGANYALAIPAGAGSSIGTTFIASASMQLAAGFLTFSNSSPFIALAAGASAGTFFTQTQSVSGAGVTMTCAAQAAKAASNTDGGAFAIAGGAGDGTGVDGSCLVKTPLNAGELEFTPVNGANNLTNAQSDANVLNLLAGATAGFTITFKRRVADTSLVFVRNNTSQTATIAYQSGGNVTVASLTSALIASNGTNLVKIMVGT